MSILSTAKNIKKIYNYNIINFYIISMIVPSFDFYIISMIVPSFALQTQEDIF